MKDQYVGDIGDFAKFSFLHEIASHAEFNKTRIGVLWYLTPNEDNPKNNDGRHIDYLDKEGLRRYSDKVFDKLKKIVKSDQRKVSALETARLLPKNTTYFNEPLSYGKESIAGVRLQQRDDWFNKSLSKIGKADIVFFDPDNGIEVKSVKISGLRANKYCYYKEIDEYFSRGKSLIIYNHRSRQQESAYENRFRMLFDHIQGLREVRRLSFHKTSPRDFIILAQAKHNKVLSDAIKSVCEWGELFTCKDISRK
jgi:hypothetical protein